MKTNTSNALITGATLSLVILAFLTASSSFAYRGDPSVQSPNYSPERHEAMTQAFAANDYNAWVELMGEKKRGRVLEVITAENFSRFAEARSLAKEGKLEESKVIRKELGLGQGRGNRDGSNGQKRGEKRGQK